MYVCTRCHQLVEAEDCKGPPEWVGPSARTHGTRLLWNGFRNNRTGPAVFFLPGRRRSPPAARVDQTTRRQRRKQGKQPCLTVRHIATRRYHARSGMSAHVTLDLLPGRDHLGSR
jgi:hypothetical protein